MNRQLLMLAGAGALALAVLGVTAANGRFADEKVIVPKDIAKAINDMADKAGKGQDAKADAEAFGKKHPDDLKKIMWAFKPRMANGEGGFGVGAKPGAYTPDGMEGLIISHGNPRRKPMMAKELMDTAKDLDRLADVTIAIADLTHAYTPKKKEPDKDPKDWTKYTDDMKKGAQDLKAAVKGNSPENAKMAFTKLYSSCTNCHAKFRD